MNNGDYVTALRGLSTFLLFALGLDALLNVTVEAPGNGRKKSRILYHFRDNGSCSNLASDFFAGVGVSNARELLESAHVISLRTTDAYRAHREQIEQAEGK